MLRAFIWHLRSNINPCVFSPLYSAPSCPKRAECCWFHQCDRLTFWKSQTETPPVLDSTQQVSERLMEGAVSPLSYGQLHTDSEKITNTWDRLVQLSVRQTHFTVDMREKGPNTWPSMPVCVKCEKSRGDAEFELVQSVISEGIMGVKHFCKSSLREPIKWKHPSFKDFHVFSAAEGE